MRRYRGISIAVMSVALLSGVSMALGRDDLARVLVGVLLLVLGAEWLVTGAARLAREFGVSPFVVGLTVVAFGTSAPELAASVRATVAGEGELAVGNVIGSNIANICLILGLTAMLRPVPVQSGVVRRDVPIVIGVTIGAIVTFVDGVIGRIEAAILASGIVAFTVFLVIAGRREVIEQALDEPEPVIRVGPSRLWLVARTLIGMVALVLGADLLVDGATALAEAMGVPSVIIGLSLVAFGTSVPELATSLAAAIKRESDIAVGNILGSNVFNILCVLGISGLVRPLDVPPLAMQRDAWVMLVVALACLPILGTARRISRLEGTLLFVTYLVYVIVIYVV